MKSIKNHFANINVNINTKNTPPPQQGRFVNHGFTIIEVALVLAIAGLIFLVVFLALPALQNSQKDAARRQDVGRVVAALQSYAADHNGDLSSLIVGTNYVQPYSSDGSTNSGLSGYLGKLSETKWVWANSPSEGYHNDPVSYGTVLFFLDKNCSGASSPGNVAVNTTLSNGTVYCVSM